MFKCQKQFQAQWNFRKLSSTYQAIKLTRCFSMNRDRRSCQILLNSWELWNVINLAFWEYAKKLQRLLYPTKQKTKYKFSFYGWKSLCIILVVVPATPDAFAIKQNFHRSHNVAFDLSAIRHESLHRHFGRLKVVLFVENSATCSFLLCDLEAVSRSVNFSLQHSDALHTFIKMCCSFSPR